MTLFVGIDLGKRRNVACAVGPDGHRRGMWKFDTSRQGYEDLLSHVRMYLEHGSPRECLVGMEATGVFWVNLCRFLEDRGFEYRLINPYTVKRVREGLNLDRTKTDQRDAVMIAELLRNGIVTETRLLAEPYASLRRAYREREVIMTRLVGVRIGVHQALDRLFPEYAVVFPDIFSATSLGVLRLGLHAADIAAIARSAFVAAVRSRSTAKRLAVGHLERLHAVATQSIAVPEGAAAARSQLLRLMASVEHLHGQLAELDRELAVYLDALPESQCLLSVPGLGFHVVAGLLAEIGDVRNYRSAGDILKLAGTHPTDNQSGEFATTKHSISKKGQGRLRKVAFQAALGCVRLNPIVHAYFERLKSRDDHPLTPMQAMGAAMNKILTIAFTLAKKRTTWDDSYDWHAEQFKRRVDTRQAV